jgi:hypothetical protein
MDRLNAGSIPGDFHTGMIALIGSQGDWARGLMGGSGCLLVLLWAAGLSAFGVEFFWRFSWPGEDQTTVHAALWLTPVLGLLASIGLKLTAKPGHRAEGVMARTGGELHVGVFNVIQANKQSAELTAVQGTATQPVVLERGDRVAVTVHIRGFVGGYEITKLVCRAPTRGTAGVLCDLAKDPGTNLRRVEVILLVRQNMLLPSVNGKALAVGPKDIVFDILDGVEAACRDLFPQSAIEKQVVFEFEGADWLRHHALAGLIGSIYSAVAESVRERKAIRDFLNGRLESSDGTKRLGDFVHEKGWSVGIARG